MAMAFLGCVMVCSALLDGMMTDGTAQQIWGVRLPCLTVLLGLFLLSYTSSFTHMMPLAIWVMAVCTASAFLSYGNLWADELRFFYGTGLAPLLLMVSLLCHATLISTTILMGVVFVAATVFWLLHYEGEVVGQWVVYSAIYVMVTVAGCLCLFRWEQSRRKQFLMFQKTELAKFSSSQLEHESEKLRFLVALDAELGIANRKSFDRTLRQEWRRGIRNQYPIALLLVHVDNAEGVSGDSSPLVGLSEVSQLAATFARRPGDLVARYGDRKVAILLVDTDKQSALVVARRIQDRLSHQRHKTKAGAVHVVSIGLTSVLPAPAVFPHDLTSTAEAALAEAIPTGAGAVVDL